jgi:MFS family permease
MPCLVIRLGFRVIVTAGAAAVALGAFLLTRLGGGGQPELSICLIVLGFGMGLIFMSTSLAAQNSVPLPRMGVATGLVNFTRQLGGAVGVAVAASVMLTSLTDRLTELFGAHAGIDTNDVLAPTGQQKVPPAVRAEVADAFAGALHQVFWVAFVIALVGLACTVLMPRGAAAKLRDEARRESKVDSVSPEGETYELTSTVA